MAFASSSVVAATASASSCITDTKKHDVFISFRGEDTRSNFTSHLHAALCRNNIETYIDYRINKGEEVWGQLVEAIKDSTLFLVIFSENYASSTWCLNELIEIFECKKNGEPHVIPVFYRIDPSQVRKQTGSYKEAFAKHRQNEEKVYLWKDVLCEVAYLSGFHSDLYRFYFIFF
ncbi:hypothetical protein VNO78_06441 [Psophocarpus tetragonolobus]|uniref:TIR domain-containing protein n=1 Tax=Psophocarpus tetragonolobus TaxID=3891 RepID=A0AAN9STP2_PSOTE